MANSKAVGKIPTKLEDVALPATGKERSLANLKRGHNRKGVPNKVNKALKDMILGALHNAGGEEYLTQQAENNPNAFMALVGKVLPVELKNQVEGGMTVTILTGVPDSKAK